MNSSKSPINQQIIVITGASSGFGKGAALKFAAAGATLILAARRENALNDLAAACNAAGGKALAVPTDVSQPQQVAGLAESAYRLNGRIDTWINNAGVGAIGLLNDIPLPDHLQVIATNLSGTLNGSYEALRYFRQRCAGTLVNVASMLGKTPSAYYASYAASKAGIITLDAALRLELEQEKQTAIHICTVLPMAMDTPFFDHAGNYTGKEAVPIPPVYDAQHVVDALFDLAVNPKDEVIVGGVGELAALAHKMMPKLVDEVSTYFTLHAQLNASHANIPYTSGNIHGPVESGVGLHTDNPQKRA